MNTFEILAMPFREKFNMYEDAILQKCMEIVSGAPVYFMDDFRKRKRVGFEFPSDIIGAGSDTARNYIARKVAGSNVLFMEEAVVFTNK